MTMMSDPILDRFRTELGDAFGARLERVVLFGSRARGDARPESDYDVAVFLEDFDSFWSAADALAEIEMSILYDTGRLINSLPLKAGSYMERTGFMRELRRDGIDL